MKHFLLLKTLASPEPGIVTPKRSSLQGSFPSPAFRQSITKSLENFSFSMGRVIKKFENPGSAPDMKRQPSSIGNGQIGKLRSVFSPKRLHDQFEELHTPQHRMYLHTQPGELRERDPWTHGHSIRKLEFRNSYEAEDIDLLHRERRLDGSITFIPDVGVLTPSSSARPSSRRVKDWGTPPKLHFGNTPQKRSQRESVSTDPLNPILEDVVVRPRLGSTGSNTSTGSTGSSGSENSVSSVNRAATGGLPDSPTRKRLRKAQADELNTELQNKGLVPVDNPLRNISVPKLRLEDPGASGTDDGFPINGNLGESGTDALLIGHNLGESDTDGGLPTKGKSGTGQKPIGGITTSESELDDFSVPAKATKLAEVKAVSSEPRVVSEEPLIRLSTDNGKIKIDDKSRSNIFDGTLTVNDVKNKLREIIEPIGTTFPDRDLSIHDVLKTVYSQFDPSKNNRLAKEGYKAVDQKWINILPKLAQVMDEVHRIIDADLAANQEVKDSMYSASDPLAATSQFSNDQKSMTINKHECDVQEQTNYNIAELLLTVFVAATTQRGSRGSFLPLAVLPGKSEQRDHYSISELSLPTGLNQSELLINESKLIAFMKEIKPGDDDAVTDSNISAMKRIAQLLDALSDQILHDKINYLRNVVDRLSSENSDALTFITDNKDSVLEALLEWPDVKNALAAELDPSQKRVKSSRTIGDFAEGVQRNTSFDLLKRLRNQDHIDPGDSSTGVHCGSVDDGAFNASSDPMDYSLDPLAMSQEVITA